MPESQGSGPPDPNQKDEDARARAEDPRLANISPAANKEPPQEASFRVTKSGG